MLPLCFCYIQPSSEGGQLCILKFENTVHSCAESTSLSSFLGLSSQAIATPFPSEIVFHVVSTSCFNKPKEYNPEQEVFVTRDPSKTELIMRTKKKKVQPSSPPPRTSFKWGV